MICTLCKSPDTYLFENVNERDYHKCNSCDLVFLDPKHFLDTDEEKSRYNFHQNNIEDKGYIEFLNRVIQPAKEFISKDDIGLDFGCGPNPVLAQMIEKDGNKCDYYDPIFFPEIRKEDYNFIFATECFEHFYNPKKELNTIVSLLKLGGVLSVMTELNLKFLDFANWYYIKDPTHVCFYSENTVEFICKTFGFENIFSDKNRVFVLKKK
ncbi:MAG: hypothetical protein C0596_07540 [Marinilabiliales bacterium]|nr:MAG: hypothetical protein C0596_07540 [Marinilabiliales bacterium]